MPDIARRFTTNPLLTPEDVTPLSPDYEVVSVFNPAAFLQDGQVHLLARVAERPVPVEGKVRVVSGTGRDRQLIEFDRDDPELDLADPREVRHRGRGFLAVQSYLRLFRSTDGERFSLDLRGPMEGLGELETFGIEDPRVTLFEDGRYLIAYTATSAAGYGIGLRTTRDFRNFESFGLVLPPANKDCALFPQRIGGKFAALHRPSGVILGGNDIWYADSPDLRHWGNHRVVARTRPGTWDGARIGGGGEPILTADGWLCLYHGADENSRYSLGALLLDHREPWRVLARSSEPIMEPLADYEKSGFFPNVVFSNGHVADGDRLLVYYGAADLCVAGAEFSIGEITQSLTFG
jgi:beta-1,2-mannobiose phosphorylase / 1,2-beta-oligomannan phosphorylase